MSQLVETGQGLAEFPDEMSHDEIAGVIKKQFFSTENLPPAEIKPVHSAKAENVIAGMDQSPSYPSKADADPLTENITGAATDIVVGLAGTVKSLPGMALSGAKMATGTSYQQRGELTKLLSEVLPMSQQMGNDLEAPLGTRESFRGIGQAALMAAPGLELLRGVRGVPKVGSLEAKLAPITGEAPPVQEVLQAPVEAGLTAKPETLTPQEEVTPQRQAEPVGVTETLAELKRRNVVTPGEVASTRSDTNPLVSTESPIEVTQDQNPFDTSATSARLSELRDSKPRPINKLYGPNPTEEQISSQQSKINKWNSEYRKATKEHKETVEKSNDWIAEQKAKAQSVPGAKQAPVESGLQAKPELPENMEVTIKASTSKGEPLEVKMDAREAEKVLNERKTALENLIDCLG